MKNINGVNKIAFWSIVVVFLSHLFPVSVLFGKEIVVIYPRPQSEIDTRENDVIELLRMSLRKTVDSDGPFKMRPSKSNMKESRYRIQLEIGKRLTIIWSTVTKELEKKLLPIRIPVRKGILGYRIFLIRKQDKEKFAAIKSLKEM